MFISAVIIGASSQCWFMHAVQQSSDAPCNRRSSSLVVLVCLCVCVGHMEHNGLQHCCRDDDVTHCPSWNAEEVRLCVLGMLGVQECCVAFISYAQSGVQFTTLSILDLAFWEKRADCTCT